MSTWDFAERNLKNIIFCIGNNVPILIYLCGLIIICRKTKIVSNKQHKFSFYYQQMFYHTWFILLAFQTFSETWAKIKFKVWNEVCIFPAVGTYLLTWIKHKYKTNMCKLCNTVQGGSSLSTILIFSTHI